MLFVLVGRFRPNSEEAHARLRENYNEHLAQRRPRVKLAGPLRDQAGTQTGVFILLEAKDMEAARDFARASPYAGLYESLSVDGLEIEVGRLD